MPEMIMLVGVPASGKSTWTENFLSTLPDHVKFRVVSSDAWIDFYCDQEGITYSEGFQKYAKLANQKFEEELKEAIKNNENIIVDRTNTTSKGRKKLMEKAPNYDFVAKVFMPDLATLKERIQKRGETTGKWIPDHVLNNMLERFEPPIYGEGFTHIEQVE